MSETGEIENEKGNYLENRLIMDRIGSKKNTPFGNLQETYFWFFFVLVFFIPSQVCSKIIVSCQLHGTVFIYLSVLHVFQVSGLGLSTAWE